MNQTNQSGYGGAEARRAGLLTLRFAESRLCVGARCVDHMDEFYSEKSHPIASVYDEVEGRRGEEKDTQSAAELLISEDFRGRQVGLRELELDLLRVLS